MKTQAEIAQEFYNATSQALNDALASAENLQEMIIRGVDPKLLDMGTGINNAFNLLGQLEVTLRNPHNVDN